MCRSPTWILVSRMLFTATMAQERILLGAHRQALPNQAKFSPNDSPPVSDQTGMLIKESLHADYLCCWFSPCGRQDRSSTRVRFSRGDPIGKLTISYDKLLEVMSQNRHFERLPQRFWKACHWRFTMSNPQFEVLTLQRDEADATSHASPARGQAQRSKSSALVRYGLNSAQQSLCEHMPSEFTKPNQRNTLSRSYTWAFNYLNACDRTELHPTPQLVSNASASRGVHRWLQAELVRYIRHLRVIAYSASIMIAAFPLTAVLLSTAVSSQTRPTAGSLSCSQAASLVASQGAAVLSTGQFTYERYVISANFCVRGEVPEPAWTRTADIEQCFIGYRCGTRTAQLSGR